MNNHLNIKEKNSETATLHAHFLALKRAYFTQSESPQDVLKFHTYKEFIAHFFKLKTFERLSLLKIQAYQQVEDYTCGPACVMSLMHYYGSLGFKDLTLATEHRIATEMGTTADKGTTPQQMVAWLEKQGFEVTLGQNGTLAMLQDNLKKGIPTIVEWIDWGGHWAIVAGYNSAASHNPEDETIYFADPSAEVSHQPSIHSLISFNADRFQKMWFDGQLLARGLYITATPKKKF